MDLLQAVVLAIVQGFTEFLPISSTAHLALAPWLLGWKDLGMAFDVALHIGTLVAVLLYFFRSWVQIAAQGFGIRYGEDPELKRNPRLLWLMAAGSAPVAVLGWAFQEKAETAWRSPYVIGGMLIGVGLLMELADRIGRRTRSLGQISLADALFIGLAQAVAIIPGTSRSGITITAALARGIDRPAAAQFSFLLSTPAIAGAAMKALYDLVHHGAMTPQMWLHIAVGVAVSGVTGWAVIALLLRYLRNNTLRLFVYYRIVFGIIVIALASFFRSSGG